MAQLSPKSPPYSLEAEQAVLGGLMLDNQTWDQVSQVLQAEDFYQPAHQLVFETLTTLSQKMQPFDVVTIVEQLKATQQLDKVGGEVFVFELANNTPSVANIKAYADIVREKSVLRQLIQVAQQVADSAFEPGERSVNELLDGAERNIFAIAEQTGKAGQFKDIKRLLSAAVDKIDKLYHSNEPITGLPTGFDDFDDLTSGLQPADLVIVAGRPSMGKTTFAINIAEYAAIKTGQPILIYSMEMPGDALAMRLISSLGRIDQQNLRTGKLSDQDWPRVTSAIHTLADAKLYIDDTPGLSPSEVRARARRMAREHGQIGLIVIDYLQLMRVPGIRIENRTAEISEISRSLKALAKELNTPVIALSQLNRSLEQRSDRRPVMSDLRESGAIEQDADLIAFIYRDEVYNEDSPDKGVAEIIIAKQRNGPIGKVRLAFLGRYTKFENLANDVYQQQVA
jgi:replicative DNA helicase